MRRPLPVPVRLQPGGTCDAAARESRRDFLKFFALSLGAGELVACARAPDDPIVPAVATAAADETAPLYYASLLERDGYADGVLVQTRYGHPCKIEGNPAHPASLGATDAVAQAAIYGLWDATRARNLSRRGELRAWPRFRGELAARSAAAARRGGAGLHVLAEPHTSPTLARLRAALREKFPAAAWHRHAALPRDNVYAGARLAFGRTLETRHDFSRADVVLALDADFVATLPGSVRYAHDFAARREPGKRGIARLFALESTPTPTGVLADHRLAMRGHELHAFAASVLARVGGTDAAAEPGAAWQPLAAAVADDLMAHRGAGLVVCGDAQPPALHALAHLLNARLGNVGATVLYSEPLLDGAADGGDSLAALCAALDAGTVETLLVLGGNPAYTAPADLPLGELVARAGWSAYLGLHDDETAWRCDWLVPQSHELESWGDACAFDGTAGIRQPAIAPLHESLAPAQLLGVLLGDARSAHDLVRETWGAQFAADPEAGWNRALRDGVIAGSAAATLIPAVSATPADLVAPPAADTLDLLFRADPCIGDGRHGANAWLQELPKPFTQLTWGNAALIAPATAARLALRDEDVVAIRCGDRRVEAPVLVVTGQAPDTLTLPLGYGRTRGGNGVAQRGFDAGRLRTAAARWQAAGSVSATGRTQALARAQPRGLLERNGPVRVLEVDAQAAVLPPAPAPGARPSLFAAAAAPPDAHAWGMTINLGACSGCNACTIACQAENNIPSVGPEEVRRGRILHWMRIDHYVEESAPEPRLHCQPVPCMHCERAPCELVCPVGATLHDSEGLNLQVYNRCVGTRFCANNCPYKVRRFNFRQYATPALRDYANPQVSVRNRGVMEKCTYCIQRIETARIAADRAGRRLGDGEVVTACQAACPTRAIVFGDINDPASAVARSKADPRNYALLGELNTAPRTTYLAKLLAPNRAWRPS
jgi:molybdopterin-containing oxidoreductase family iron-sulfur binding subunit